MEIKHRITGISASVPATATPPTPHTDGQTYRQDNPRGGAIEEEEDDQAGLDGLTAYWWRALRNNQNGAE